MAKTAILKNLQSRTGTQDNRAISLTVKDIPIGEIQKKENIRKEYTDLEELKASIREYGLIQPITVYKEGDGYVVKTGHRRFMAYKVLHEKEPERFHSIRCMITDNDNIVEIQLVENLLRVDISQLDFAYALNALKEKGMTHKEIANVLGKSEGHIKNLFMGIIEIVKYPALKDLISQFKVTIQEIAETKGIKNIQERLDILKKRGNKEITLTEMKEAVKAIKEGNQATKALIAVQNSPPTLSPGSTDGSIERQPTDLYLLAIEEMVPPDSTDKAQTRKVPDSQFSVTYDGSETPETGKIQVSVERQPGQESILVSIIKGDNKQSLSILEKDLRAYFSQQRRYQLENSV